MNLRKFPFPVWMVSGLLVCATFAPAFPVVDYPLPATPLLNRDHVPTGAWLDFQEEHPRWRVLDWDRFHVLPHRAWGDGIPLGKGAVLSGEDLDHRLREFMNRYPDLFRPTETVLKPAHLGRHGKLWYARYDQYGNGHRLEQTETVFRVTADGRLVMFGSDLIPSPQLREPGLNRAEAEQRLLRNLEAGETVRSLESGDYVYLPVYSGRSLRLEPAYFFELNLTDPQKDYRVFLSAVSGKILWSWNVVRDITVTGTLQAAAELYQPGDDDLLPVPHITFQVAGVDAVTDSVGNYSVEVDSDAPWTIFLTLDGLFANVNRMDGSDGMFLVSQTENGQTITIDGETTQIQERDAYLNVTRVHDFIKNIDPSFTGLDFPLPVNINYNQYCNAYWDGNSVNFFSEGSGCPNTARVSGVVYHEYGHGINDRQYLQAGAPYGLTNGSMHEGLADVNAVYLQDIHYVSPGWFIRDLDNDNTYPQDISGEVHYDGMIIGGALWDMRQNLNDLELARYLVQFARWGTPDDPETGRCYFEFFTELVLVDDDNGDMSDLTPHWDTIDAAFNEHGIGSVLTWMGTEFHVVDPQIFNDPGTPLQITVVGSFPPYFVPSDPSLVYTINDGDPQELLLTPGDNDTWQGEIPGQNWGTVVSYYVSAGDFEITDPPGAPEQQYRAVFTYFDGLGLDFEDDNAEANAGELWEWGLPLVGPDQAHSGEKVWGTNLDGNYSDNTLAQLTFPPQIVINDAFTMIQFHHWLSVESGWDGVNVQISINGGAFQFLEPLQGYDFTTPENNAWPGVPALTGVSDGWQPVVFDLTNLVSSGDEVAMRLNLMSDTGVNSSGWYIDDLLFLGFAAPPGIVHEPLHDTEEITQETFPVVAQLNSNVDIDSFHLYYRFNGGEIHAAEMQPTGNPREYASSIPGPPPETLVEYRLEAVNDVGYHASFPAEPDSWWPFYVGVDVVPPQVDFLKAPQDIIGRSATFQVEALATDNLGVEAVFLEWQPEGGDWSAPVPLAAGGENTWSLDFYFHDESSDSYNFRLLAVDAANQANSAYSEPVQIGTGQYQLLDTFPTAELTGWTVDGEAWCVQNSRVFEGDYALGSNSTPTYPVGYNGSVTLAQPLDLEYAGTVILNLQEVVFMAPGDTVFIEASSDGGAHWQLIAARNGGHNWQLQQFDLSALAGSPQVHLRFRFAADNNDGGLHFGYFADVLELTDGTQGTTTTPSAPVAFTLSQAYPNPFNPETHLDLSLAVPGELRVELFNIRGQSITTLLQGEYPAGQYTVSVDGASLASGIYLVRALHNGTPRVRKLILLK